MVRQTGTGIEDEVLYRRPPLVETSLGVGFPSVAGWNVHHFGLLFASIRELYPRFDTANPIALGGGQSSGVPIFAIGPKIRAFYSNEERSRLVQVQDDIFFANWQKMGSEAAYPRYERLKSSFMSDWNRFDEFLTSNGLTPPPITRYQLTYINAIERISTDSQSLDIQDVFAEWTVSRSLRAEAERTDANLSVAYRIGDVDLSYVVQSALRISDLRPVIQFTLTCGCSKIDQHVDIATLDRLHTTLVAAFEDFTSDRAKKVWGKVRE